jgi:tRNA threonylcarbamoyladenosine biosynthesis protein TsaE
MKGLRESIDEAVRSGTGSVITRSPEQTFEFGLRVGRQLTGPAVFLLHGELGSGKTLWTKGLAAGLGIDPLDVTSPSFTLINEHGGGRLRLYHVDLYRLESGALPELGLEEILADDGAVVVVEWAERLAARPANPFDIQFNWLSTNERSITFSSAENPPTLNRRAEAPRDDDEEN